MDFKRNKRFFSDSFGRKLTVITICGVLLAVLGLALWYFVWISSLVSNLFTISAIIGVGMCIGAISIRPKVKDITDQIDDARLRFIDSTAEKLNFPNDFENDCHLVWGFLEGNAEKKLKSGEIFTDRLQFTALYMKRSQLYVRTECCSLIEDGSDVNEYALPFAETTISADASSLTLTITSPEVSLTIPLQAVDYQLEEYIAKVHRQIKKAV